MQCPVCKTTSLGVTVLPEGPRAYACKSCGGKFVKVDQYLNWRTVHGKDLPETPAETVAPLSVVDSGPGKLCPDCGAFLIRHKVGHGVAFHLDRCFRCGGVWLDDKEWDVLQSRNLHDDIHLIFSDAWQNEVKRQEREESYRQVVDDILDQKLSHSCNASDAAQVKKFAIWMLGRPNCDEIFAYLSSMHAR